MDELQIAKSDGEKKQADPCKATKPHQATQLGAQR
jgi:hypothetical protein